MGTEMMRKELREMIEAASAEKVEEMYEKITESEDDLQLTEDDIKELDKRRARYLAGEGKSYTWEEAKEIIRNKHKQ